MDDSDRVTVERSYFETLLRRLSSILKRQPVDTTERPNANVTTQRRLQHQLQLRLEHHRLQGGVSEPSEYHVALSLEIPTNPRHQVRTHRAFQALKGALIAGGTTEETINILISNPGCQRKDSGVDTDNDGFVMVPQQPGSQGYATGVQPAYKHIPWRTGSPAYELAAAPGTAIFTNPRTHPDQAQAPGSEYPRQVSYRMPAVADANCLAADDDIDMMEDAQLMNTDLGRTSSNEHRSLFFSGLSDRTTYRDLLSVIKGGKVLSVILLDKKSAVVSFVDQGVAEEFLAWSKRNDIYVQTKRVSLKATACTPPTSILASSTDPPQIEVKWADRQFQLKPFTNDKVIHGATRNLFIRNAVAKGHTEAKIRDDMEHIHNLVIISVDFRGNDAFVSTNSIHTALFARTCMMSRTTYKGCKVEFYPDECDVPLPPRTQRKYTMPAPVVEEKKPTMANRYRMLDLAEAGEFFRQNAERNAKLQNLR
ncbi:uncharacterized protein LTR77_005784 [Saxophila tyrrhenica]|uniref:RRM domain-containing protein n=1 Tax=Saxophila tyrrhenica TaxID=1690608 RepID=A0AAV9PBQ2_9PEZI|nr:hypothetical protein LTR77_005784 [Saxophila tyrrhenica]